MPQGGLLGRAFMPAVVNANNTTENYDHADRDRRGGAARREVLVGRLLPARRERKSSAALPQPGRHDFGHGLAAVRAAALGARRRGQSGQSEPDRLPRDDTRDPAFNANAAGCVPLNILGNTSANPGGHRLRVPHAQGGQRVQAGRARLQLPQHARSRAGQGRSGSRPASSGERTRPTRRTISRISRGTRRTSSRTASIAAATST